MQMPLHPASAPRTKGPLLTDEPALWYLNISLPTTRRFTSVRTQRLCAGWGLGERLLFPAAVGHCLPSIRTGNATYS